MKVAPPSLILNLLNLRFTSNSYPAVLGGVKSVSRSDPPPVVTDILRHVSIPLAEKRWMTSEPITRVKLQKCGHTLSRILCSICFDWSIYWLQTKKHALTNHFCFDNHNKFHEAIGLVKTWFRNFLYPDTDKHWTVLSQSEDIWCV